MTKRREVFGVQEDTVNFQSDILTQKDSDGLDAIQAMAVEALCDQQLESREAKANKQIHIAARSSARLKNRVSSTKRKCEIGIVLDDVSFHPHAEHMKIKEKYRSLVRVLVPNVAYQHPSFTFEALT